MIAKKILSSILITLTAGLILVSCETINIGKEPTAQELIKNGEIDKAKSLFQIRSDINEVDEDGNTVLHLAAMIDDADLVTYFIIKGADVHLRNRDGDTPLHVAINYKSLNAAKVLAVKETCLFDENISGRTALDAGLNKDQAFYDIFITKETGALTDKTGKSIVHYFVEYKNLQAIKLCAKKEFLIQSKTIRVKLL